jgi:hypothetical protein
MMLGIVLLLASNAAICVAAVWLRGRFPTGRLSTDAVAFLLLRFALISIVVLGTGAAGVLTPVGVGLSSLVLGAIPLALGYRPRLPRRPMPDVWPPLLALGALLALLLGLQVWFFVPFHADVIAYHLPKVAEWVHAGRITREVGLDFRAVFPAGFELIEVWWTVFLHHDVLIEMAGVEFLILAFTGAWALARGMGLTSRSSALAALLYATTPGLLLQATSCFNDAPLAALEVALAALLVGRAPYGLALLAVGLGLGVKPTFGLALPGMALLAWFWSRDAAPTGSRHSRWAYGAGGIGLLIGATWYVRNAVLFGSPLYPSGPDGIVNPQGQVLVPARPSLARLGVNLQSLADVRLYDPGPYAQELTHSSGWGTAAVALGLVALLLAAREESGFRRLGAAFALPLAFVLALAMPDPNYMRFALLFPALLCVAIGWLAERRPVLRWIALAAMLLQIVATSVPEELPTGGLGDLAGTSWRERRSCGLELPPGAIGVYSNAGHLAYSLYGPDLSHRVVYLRAETGPDLRASLKAEHLTWICAPAHHPVIREAIREGWLRRDVGPFLSVQ